jgi:hypothetical protein
VLVAEALAFQISGRAVVVPQQPAQPVPRADLGPASDGDSRVIDAFPRLKGTLGLARFGAEKPPPIARGVRPHVR